MNSKKIRQIGTFGRLAAFCGVVFAVAVGAGRLATGAESWGPGWVLTDRGQNPVYVCEKQVPPGNAAAGTPITSLANVSQCKPTGDGRLRCRALYVYGNGYRYAPTTTCTQDVVPTDKGQNPAYLCEKQVPPGNAAAGTPITSLINVTQCQPSADGRLLCRALYVYGNGYRYAPKTLCVKQ